MSFLLTSRMRGPDDPVRCGEQIQSSGVRQVAFSTPQFATVYLIEGTGDFHDDQGRLHRLQAGDAFHRFPDRPHTWLTRERCRTIFAAIPATAFATLQALQLPGLDQAVIHPGLRPELIRRLRQLRIELHGHSPRRSAAIATKLQAWLVDLHLVGAGEDLVERACRLLAEASTDRRSLPTLLAPLGIGYAQLRKRFTRELGLSPGAFRIQCRLQQAQQLLADGDRSIASIAETLGFPDSFSFSKQFRRHCGCSPRAWRQHQLGR